MSRSPSRFESEYFNAITLTLVRLTGVHYKPNLYGKVGPSGLNKPMADQAPEALGRTAQSPRWVTLRRACEILGVDESTLRRWADTGRLRSIALRAATGASPSSTSKRWSPARRAHRGSDEMERIAAARIRRQLQRARQQEQGWYASLSDEQPLSSCATSAAGWSRWSASTSTSARAAPAFWTRRWTSAARYGRIFTRRAAAASAVGAYIGFRRTIDETTRQTAVRESMPMEEALAACRPGARPGRPGAARARGGLRGNHRAGSACLK